MALKIFLIACEASGDKLGAKLMAAIKKQRKDVTFAGMGGPEMRKQGLKSASDMCGVIGFLDVILKFFQFYSLLKLVIEKATKFQPDLVITIDSWDFCSLVTKKLKNKLSKAKFVHYVSPSVWLYRQGRIKEMKELYDLLLVVFPFETKFYEKVGMLCKFIGHPMVEDFYVDPHFLGHHNKRNAKLLGVMVGSRPAEIKRLLPIFVKAVKKFLSTQKENFLVVFPAINAKVAKLFQATPMPFEKQVIDASKLNDKERVKLFKSFHLAIAKSGTTTLELTLAGVPMVVAYKIDSFSMFIAKHIFNLHKKTPYICMTNILLNEAIVPEFVQENCQPDKIAHGLQNIMDFQIRKNMLLKYQKVGKMLSHSKRSPSDSAAKLVLSCLNPNFK